jgi:hypothetical protein
MRDEKGAGDEKKNSNYTTLLEGEGSSRPLFHPFLWVCAASVCRFVDLYRFATFLQLYHQDISSPYSRTCLLSSPLSSVVPRSLRQFIPIAIAPFF